MTTGSMWVFAQFAILLLIGAAVLTSGGDPQVPTTIAAVVLFVAGQGIAVAAALKMKQYISAHPAPAPGATLLQDGIYGMVRHPMYGGVMLMALAVALFDRNAIALLLTAGLVAVFFGKSRYEESLLADVFLGYGEYRAKVRRRFIPLLF